LECWEKVQNFCNAVNVIYCEMCNKLFSRMKLW
jgi:hypothetical protein